MPTARIVLRARGFLLALATEGGEVVKVLATHEQIDMLVDELEDILNSSGAPDPDEPPEAA